MRDLRYAHVELILRERQCSYPGGHKPLGEIARAEATPQFRKDMQLWQRQALM